MKLRYDIIDRILEIEVYIYIVFMFLTKGEGIRNIALFSGFFLWLLTIKQRNDTWIFRERVPILFWSFAATILISAIFSIDPLYSLKAIKEDAIKAVIIFCLVSTVLSDEKRLRRFVHLSFFILVFIISAGYYSYFVYDLPLMKPLTTLKHSWHAQFAVDINTLLPFTIILFLTTADKRIKVVLFGVFILSISAVILSTSRGGWAGFLGSTAVWMVYMSMIYRVSVKRIAAVFSVIAVLAATVVYFSPNIKERFTSIKSDAASFHERTDIWTPLVAAALERPVFGWGYGPNIFMMDKPFENTPYKVAPVNIKPAFRNPHNPFLRVLFHQGVAGLIPYIALLIVAAGTFWKGAVFQGRTFASGATRYLKKGESADMKNYILVACTSIIIGTYFVNAIVENSHITEVAFVLGVGLAAFNLKNENSHT